MRKYLSYLILSILIVSFTVLVSRSFRPSQIPNGNINSCSNCHVSAGGGGARNSFGETVRTGYLKGSPGDVDWGPDLAAIDSDGDGFTNGEELQDPNGTWKEGDPAPGDPSLVTNPGDENSKPNPTSIAGLGLIPDEYTLENNFPNPFNPSTNISFSVAKASTVKIEIFNTLGQLVKTVVDGSFGPGTYSSTWNAKDEYGTQVSSGMYIYRMIAASINDDEKFVDNKRMLLVK